MDNVRRTERPRRPKPAADDVPSPPAAKSSAGSTSKAVSKPKSSAPMKKAVAAPPVKPRKGKERAPPVEDGAAAAELSTAAPLQPEDQAPLPPKQQPPNSEVERRRARLSAYISLEADERSGAVAEVARRLDKVLLWSRPSTACASGSSSPATTCALLRSGCRSGWRRPRTCECEKRERGARSAARYSGRSGSAAEDMKGDRRWDVRVL